VPNSASAAKRVRQTAKRRAINRWRRVRIKDQVKDFRKAVHDGDVKAAETTYRDLCGILDRTACTSTMHRNKAARDKSRLARRLNDLKKSKKLATNK